MSGEGANLPTLGAHAQGLHIERVDATCRRCAEWTHENDCMHRLDAGNVFTHRVDAPKWRTKFVDALGSVLMLQLIVDA